MNNGAFGEGFPYSNFHDLNMDWIIKIVKDFLDQYTTIQETIQTGLDDLDAKATELEGLLQEWYNTHSEDIANQLAQALLDLNTWYTTHEHYLDNTLAENIAAFSTEATTIANNVIASIPADYSELSDTVDVLSSKYDQITGRTRNIFNAYAEPEFTFYTETVVDHNDITVTSTDNRKYTVVIFKVDTSDINHIFVNPYTYTGNGQQTIRIGTYPEGVTTPTWFSTVDPDNGFSYDTTDYDNIAVGLYAHYSGDDPAPFLGEYVTYHDVMIVTDADSQVPYEPYYTAIDYQLRSELEITFTEPENYTLPSSIWTPGSINASGELVSQANSIRSNEFIKVDHSFPLYLQAYYELPTDLVEITETLNNNMRNAYIIEYDADQAFIRRQTFNLAQIIEGSTKTLSPNCEYVKIAFYTRYNNSNMEDIIPNTLYIDSVNNEHWLPPYYESYLQTKAERIEELARQAAGQGNVFIFITDEHAPNYNAMRSPEVIHRLAELVHLPILFSGGDVDQNGTQTYVYCDALRKNFNRIHHAVGNHDFLSLNTGNNLYYDMDIYNENQVGSELHHYYYVDDKQTKTRYIVLAAYMESEAAMGTGEGTSAQGGYTEEQIQWLYNEALNTDYDIIVITHYFYTINASTRAANLSYGSSILARLSQNSKVLAVFQGHTHFDRIVKGHDPNTGNLPVIITACDKNIMYQSEQWYVNRSKGTIYEQCFDVVILNKKTRTGYAIRIGGLAENGVNDSPGTPSEERQFTF